MIAQKTNTIILKAFSKQNNAWTAVKVFINEAYSEFIHESKVNAGLNYGNKVVKADLIVSAENV